jgi:hypothetical protein
MRFTSQRWQVSALLTLFALVVPATHASAQSYARTVWEQLDRAYTTASGNGYTTRNYILGRLDQGDTDTWSLTLYSGNDYKVVGACDGDCRDVDLFVEDDDGRTVGSDESRDDTPIVNVHINNTGTYKFKVKMYDCKENPCYYGISIFFKRS